MLPIAVGHRGPEVVACGGQRSRHQPARLGIVAAVQDAPIEFGAGRLAEQLAELLGQVHAGVGGGLVGHQHDRGELAGRYDVGVIPEADDRQRVHLLQPLRPVRLRGREGHGVPGGRVGREGGVAEGRAAHEQVEDSGYVGGVQDPWKLPVVTGGAAGMAGGLSGAQEWTCAPRSARGHGACRGRASGAVRYGSAGISTRAISGHRSPQGRQLPAARSSRSVSAIDGRGAPARIGSDVEPRVPGRCRGQREPVRDPGHRGTGRGTRPRRRRPRRRPARSRGVAGRTRVTGERGPSCRRCRGRSWSCWLSVIVVPPCTGRAARRPARRSGRRDSRISVSSRDRSSYSTASAASSASIARFAARRASASGLSSERAAHSASATARTPMWPSSPRRPV